MDCLMAVISFIVRNFIVICFVVPIGISSKYLDAVPSVITISSVLVKFTNRPFISAEPLFFIVRTPL